MSSLPAWTVLFVAWHTWHFTDLNNFYIGLEYGLIYYYSVSRVGWRLFSDVVRTLNVLWTSLLFFSMGCILNIMESLCPLAASNLIVFLKGWYLTILRVYSRETEFSEYFLIGYKICNVYLLQPLLRQLLAYFEYLNFKAWQYCDS